MGLGGGLEMGVGMGEGVTGCGCTGAAWTAGRCSITGCCWKPACYVHSIPVSYLQQIWLARYHDPKYGHPYPCTQQRLDHVWRHGIDAVQVLSRLLMAQHRRNAIGTCVCQRQHADWSPAQWPIAPSPKGGRKKCSERPARFKNRMQTPWL